MFSCWWNLQERSMRQNSPYGFLIRTLFQHGTAVHGLADGLTDSLNRVPAKKWLPSTRLIFPAWWRSAMFQMCFKVFDMSARSWINGLFSLVAATPVEENVLLTARTNYINVADYKSFLHFIWIFVLWFVFDVAIRWFSASVQNKQTRF